jgi:hypothetical protein
LTLDRDQPQVIVIYLRDYERHVFIQPVVFRVAEHYISGLSKRFLNRSGYGGIESGKNNTALQIRVAGTNFQ